MSSRLVTGLLLTCCLAPCFQAEAQTSKSSSDLYAEAVTAYFAKDYNGADSVLTGLIENGTGDPRAFYIRGLSRYASGNLDAADIDFEAGARLEYSGLVRVNVPRSLERIQGPVRRVLEKFRRLAQRNSALASRPHKRERALLQLTADGTEAFLTGKHKVAVQLLDVSVSNGSNDPRTYYFRGLAKQQLGLSDEAATDYKTAIGLELHPANRVDVDLALESVQGATRLALEKHRHEAISAARKVSDKERQTMIASLIEKRTTGKGGAAIAKSAINLPPGTASPMPTATAPTTTAPTTPSTSPTTPAKPATKATPHNTQPAANANALNVAWLPLDSEVVININVRELWNSPMLTTLKETPETKVSLQMMQDELGMLPRDIDSVTVGFSGATELAMAGVADPTALASGKDLVVMVVRTRSPFDPQVVQRRTEEFETATHDGKQFYRSLKTDEIPSVYIADSKTVVLAEEELLTVAIEQGQNAVARPEFDFLDASNHVTIGFVPNDPFALTESIATEGSGSKAMDRLGSALKDQLLGVGLGISATDSLDVDIRMLCVDASAATEVDASIADLMNEAKGLWALAKGGLPPAISGVVDSIIRAQKNSATAEVASISTRLSAQSIERAVEGAKEMLPMLMMGAMAELGGEMVPGDVEKNEIDDPNSIVGPETAPVATKPAEGLTIIAEAAITEAELESGADGSILPSAIDIRLFVTGPQAAAASGYGFPVVTSAVDNNGAELTLRKRTRIAGTDRFDLFDRDEYPKLFREPTNGFYAHFGLSPVEQPSKSIALAEGVIKMRVVARSDQIFVDDPSNLVDSQIDQPELVSEGYELNLRQTTKKFSDGVATIWRFSWLNPIDDPAVLRRIGRGGYEGLQSPKVVNSKGDALDCLNHTDLEMVNGQETLVWNLTFATGTQIPADARLRFTINKEVDIVDVPFKMEDVAIKTDFTEK